MNSYYLARKAEHDSLAQHVAEFEANGGVVQKCETGAQSLPYGAVPAPFHGNQKYIKLKQVTMEKLLAAKAADKFLAEITQSGLALGTIAIWMRNNTQLAAHCRSLGLVFSKETFKKQVTHDKRTS
jgi:hypothetical protein